MVVHHGDHEEDEDKDEDEDEDEDTTRHPLGEHSKSPRMRWYPPQEDTRMAAIATMLSNRATAELEDMKRSLVRLEH